MRSASVTGVNCNGSLVAAVLRGDGLRRMQQLVMHVIERSLSPVENDAMPSLCGAC